MKSPTRAGKPIAIAGPKEIRPAMDRFLASCDLGEILFVELDEYGYPPPQLADVPTVLWRHGRVSRQWATNALASLPALQWAHSDFVGVDGLPLDQLRSRNVVLTNGLGNYSRPMAEWVILSMLSAVKRFPDFVRLSDAGAWDPRDELDEVDGKVALLLGLGSVNSLVAPMADALGIQVIAATRTPRETLPPGVQRLITDRSWMGLLNTIDFLVLGVPQTPQTERIVNEHVFSELKPGAWLINVARGGIVDESALISALDKGHLGGAVLDAFDTEPLPNDHPLWKRPNVIVLPHHTWSSKKVKERIEKLFFQQLLRFARHQSLHNVVNLEAGY